MSQRGWRIAGIAGLVLLVFGPPIVCTYGRAWVNDKAGDELADLRNDSATPTQSPETLGELLDTSRIYWGRVTKVGASPTVRPNRQAVKGSFDPEKQFSLCEGDVPDDAQGKDVFLFVDESERVVAAVVFDGSGFDTLDAISRTDPPEVLAKLPPVLARQVISNAVADMCDETDGVDYESLCR